MTPTSTSGAAVHIPEPQLHNLPTGKDRPCAEAGDEGEDGGSVGEAPALDDNRRTVKSGRRRGPESRAERAVREEHEKDSVTVAALFNSEIDLDVASTVRPHMCAPSMYNSRLMQSSTPILLDDPDTKEEEADVTAQSCASL